MQFFNERVVNGVVQQRTFICSCNGVVSYRNVHVIEEPTK